MSIENLRKDGLHPNADEHEHQEDDPDHARCSTQLGALPRLVVRQGNGWSVAEASSAAAEFGPFDAIHVGAAAPGPDVPEALLRLLKPGGRMILPIGAPRTQQRWTMVDRAATAAAAGAAASPAQEQQGQGQEASSEEYTITTISTVRFVPLVQ
jgi:protein-L-isoaspartate O-methyltransferase